MGVGALEALRAQGPGGQGSDRRHRRHQVGGRGGEAGEFVCTVTSDPYWQGGIGLSMGLMAYEGKFDPAKEPRLHREFNATTVKITRENVDDYIKTQVDSHPDIDWNNLWNRVASPIVYS